MLPHAHVTSPSLGRHHQQRMRLVVGGASCARTRPVAAPSRRPPMRLPPASASKRDDRSADAQAKQLKRLKKVVRQAEEQLDALRQIATSSSLDADAIAQCVDAMRQEREAWEAMLANQRAMQTEFLSELKGLVARPASSNGASKDEEESEKDDAPSTAGEPDLKGMLDSVSTDILGAISQVGFPDGYTEEDVASFSVQDDTSDAAADADAADADAPAVPPVLTMGCDDIAWMARLHDALEGEGFYVSDEEREDWYFGETTQSAVMTFQAAHGISENGSVTLQEWRILLKGREGEFDLEGGGSGGGDGEATVGDDEEGPATPVPTPTSAPAAPPAASSAWKGEKGKGGRPLLQEGDGGEEVRRLVSPTQACDCVG